MPRTLTLLTLTMLTAATAAQAPTPEPRQESVEKSYLGSYDESVSRDLFTACDADRDDRLDVFEAADALHRLRGPGDAEAFARIDTDRDGYLGWPEFDQIFRRTIETGGTFRVRVCRPYTEPPKPPQPPSPLQKFLEVHDVDDDGALSPAEIDKLIETTGLPAPIAAPLRALDLDRSGKVEEAELAPWFQMLPLAGAGAAGASPLPQPWFDADANSSGSIELDELRAVLRRVDPSLLRWAKELLQKLDRNKDQKLQQAELPLPAPAILAPATSAPAEDVPPRPPQR